MRAGRFLHIRMNLMCAVYRYMQTGPRQEWFFLFRLIKEEGHGVRYKYAEYYCWWAAVLGIMSDPYRRESMFTGFVFTLLYYWSLTVAGKYCGFYDCRYLYLYICTDTDSLGREYIRHI